MHVSRVNSISHDDCALRMDSHNPQNNPSYDQQLQTFKTTVIRKQLSLIKKSNCNQRFNLQVARNVLGDHQIHLVSRVSRGFYSTVPSSPHVTNETQEHLLWFIFHGPLVYSWSLENLHVFVSIASPLFLLKTDGRELRQFTFQWKIQIQHFVSHVCGRNKYCPGYWEISNGLSWRLLNTRSLQQQMGAPTHLTVITLTMPVNGINYFHLENSALSCPFKPKNVLE